MWLKFKIVSFFSIKFTVDFFKKFAFTRIDWETMFLFPWNTVTTKPTYFCVLDQTKHMCDDKRSLNEWKCNSVIRTLAQHYSHSAAAGLSLLFVRSPSFFFVWSISLAHARHTRQCMFLCSVSTYSKHNIRLNLILPYLHCEFAQSARFYGWHLSFDSILMLAARAQQLFKANHIFTTCLIGRVRMQTAVNESNSHARWWAW